MNKCNHARRMVLKGLVASGAGAVLAACDSQQATPPAATDTPSANPVAPSAAPEVARRTTGQAKLTQEQVQYQTEPHGEQRCENCRHFIAEANECRLVEGVILPEGWCIIWAA